MNAKEARELTAIARKRETDKAREFFNQQYAAVMAKIRAAVSDGLYCTDGAGMLSPIVVDALTKQGFIVRNGIYYVNPYYTVNWLMDGDNK